MDQLYESCREHSKKREICREVSSGDDVSSLKSKHTPVSQSANNKEVDLPIRLDRDGPAHGSARSSSLQRAGTRKAVAGHDHNDNAEADWKWKQSGSLCESSGNRDEGPRRGSLPRC